MAKSVLDLTKRSAKSATSVHPKYADVSTNGFHQLYRPLSTERSIREQDSTDAALTEEHHTNFTTKCRKIWLWCSSSKMVINLHIPTHDCTSAFG